MPYKNCIVDYTVKLDNRQQLVISENLAHKYTHTYTLLQTPGGVVMEALGETYPIEGEDRTKIRTICGELAQNTAGGHRLTAKAAQKILDSLDLEDIFAEDAAKSGAEA